MSLESPARRANLATTKEYGSIRAMTPDALSATLERIAWAAAGALELREVFPAVAEAAAAILPFDRVSLLQFDGPRILRLYTLAGRLPAPSPETEVSLEDLSPGIRPSLHSARRIEDLEPVLSPTYKVDRWWGEQRLRSALWVPIILRGQPGGFLCLTSRTAGAFTPQHEAAIGSIAAVVGLALPFHPGADAAPTPPRPHPPPSSQRGRS